MTPRRLSLGLIVALGSFVAHEFGYALAGFLAWPGDDLVHDYLGSVTAFAVPAAIAGLAWLVVRSEAIPVGSFRWSTVALVSGAQMTLFSAQELVEATIAGEPLAALVQPAVAIGLLLQPFTAWFLLSAAVAGRHLVELIESSAGVRWQRSVGPVVSLPVLGAAGIVSRDSSPPSLRGPPVALAD